MNAKITFGLAWCMSGGHDERTIKPSQSTDDGTGKKGREGRGMGRGRTGARRGGEGEKSERAEKVVLVSIRRKQSEISR